eukprot:gene6881-13957_t
MISFSLPNACRRVFLNKSFKPARFAALFTTSVDKFKTTIEEDVHNITKSKLKESRKRAELLQSTLEDALTSPTLLSVTIDKSSKPSPTVQFTKSKKEPCKSPEDYVVRISKLKESEWTKALSLLEEARSRSMDILACYEETVSRCVASGKWRTVLDVLDHMHAKNLPLTEHMVSTAILCCVNNGQQAGTMAAYKLFAHMVAAGLPRSRSVYTALLPALCHNGLYDEFEWMWAQLQSESPGVKPSAVVCACRIEVTVMTIMTEGEGDGDNEGECVMRGIMKARSQLMEFQKVIKTAKVGTLYQGLLRGLILLGHAKIADEFIDEMSSLNLTPSPQGLNPSLPSPLSSTLSLSPLPLQSPLPLPGESWAARLVSTMAHQWGVGVGTGTGTGTGMDASTAQWLPDVIHDLGIAGQWELAISISKWTGPSIDSEISLQRALCRSGQFDIAIQRHKGILYNSRAETEIETEDIGSKRETESIINTAQGIQIRTENETSDIIHRQHQQQTQRQQHVAWEYSVELSQTLLNALCCEDHWEGVHQLLSDLCQYEGDGTSDTTMEYVLAIEEKLPGLFHKAMSLSRETRGGLGQVSVLLGLMGTMDVTPTWTTIRTAMRALDEECRWEEMVTLFVNRRDCTRYQAMYRLAVRACGATGQWSLALDLLMDLLDEAREVVAMQGEGEAAALTAVRKTVVGEGHGNGTGNGNMNSKSSNNTGSLPVPSPLPLPLSATVFGEVVRVLAEQEKFAESLEVIRHMKQLDIRPTHSSMVSALRLQSINPVFRGILLRELLRAGMPMLPYHDTHRQKQGQGLRRPSSSSSPTMTMTMTIPTTTPDNSQQQQQQQKKKKRKVDKSKLKVNLNVNVKANL